MQNPHQGAPLEAVRELNPSSVPQNTVAELAFETQREAGADPWAEIELDVEFTDPEGTVRAVPAFWAGGRTWRARYSSGLVGPHSWRTSVAAGSETGLEDIEGELTVTPYQGPNPLYAHGPVVIAADGRHLAHADGKPFLWLADTWWLATTERMRWPEPFKRIADDRVANGFNVVQLTAGFGPELKLGSRMLASEGGQPWLGSHPGTVNPSYWEVPDRKIEYLVEQGIVPCVFGAWAYWIDVFGLEGAKSHWRYLVARYGAYPVVWCVAGEVGLMRDYDGSSEEEKRAQIAEWEEVARYLGELDPFGRVRAVHPDGGFSFSSSEAFSSPASYELDMLQTGQDGSANVPRTMEHLLAALGRAEKPVLNGEVNYEGHFGSCWHDLQRFHFWSHMLSGTSGHTYGAVPIACFSGETDPLTGTYMSRIDSHTWEEAVEWLGAVHLGVGKRILEDLDWQGLEPCQEAVVPHAGPDDWFLPYAARTVEGGLLVYVPGLGMSMGTDWMCFKSLELSGLRPNTAHTLTFLDPRSGERHSGDGFETNSEGSFTLTSDLYWLTPTGEDWVLLISPSAD